MSFLKEHIRSNCEQLLDEEPGPSCSSTAHAVGNEATHVAEDVNICTASFNAMVLSDETQLATASATKDHANYLGAVEIQRPENTQQQQQQHDVLRAEEDSDSEVGDEDEAFGVLVANNKMEEEQFDLDLIEAVKQYPAIYDHSHVDYKQALW
uniref:Uncharacterized protein n=1 Tax=Glossina pallidipes TaxID=7398 RepID=A0A1B0A661_GLOPL